MNTTIAEAARPAQTFSLTSQQVAFFHTFGFLKLPGLFKADADRLIAGFDEAFATHAPDKVITDDMLQDTDNPVFTDRKRSIIFRIVERTESLRWLMTDARIRGIVQSLVGDRYEARPTDGHIFDCDTSWHPDMGSDDRFRVKLSFYLDPQRANSGAIRLIPGSHYVDCDYSKTLLQDLYGRPQKVRQVYGVEAEEIPCCTIDTDPGDLLCWNFRTFHATFHGFQRRRLFSMTFAESHAA
jgi:hypothetical protein